MAEIIVIKFYEKLVLKVPGTQDAFTQWAVVSATKDKDGNNKLKTRRIDHREAIRLIKENDLVEALRNKDGVVFDTKDNDFQKKYKGVPIPMFV